MKLINFPSNTPFKMLYQGSQDGFKPSNFRSKVDKASTLTLIRTSKGFVFGGYTWQDWNGERIYKFDPNAFLFSLVNSFNYPVKLNTIDSLNAIYASSLYGPSFGKEHDFYTYWDWKLNKLVGFSNIGQSFENLVFPNFFLTGSSFFVVEEIEVFQIDGIFFLLSKY